MVCENCQAEISDNAVICPHCKSFTKNMTPEIQKKLKYSIDDTDYTKLRKNITKVVFAFIFIFLCVLILPFITIK